MEAMKKGKKALQLVEWGLKLRNLLLDALRRRGVPSQVVGGFSYYLNYFRDEFAPAEYGLSITSLASRVKEEMKLSDAEKELMRRDIKELEDEFYSVREEFNNFKKRRKEKDFDGVVRRFNNMVEKASRLAKHSIQTYKGAESEVINENFVRHSALC